MKRTDTLTGSAGVYFIAAQINAMGYHAALTIRNVPLVDVLASTLDGSASVGIQVKTTRLASRTRVKDAERVIYEYQWAMSENSWNAAIQSKNLLFAFVDLNCEHSQSFPALPDVFIVPTAFLKEYCFEVVNGKFGGDSSKWKFKRLHVDASKFEKYKNNWAPLARRLRVR